MGDAAPTVSVVIPTYNQPRFLLETLRSVFAQTYADYEVIVVNDGSTDDTLEQLRPLMLLHPDRLRVVTQANAGTGAARNRGIEESRGRYIALLDHDDLWMPGKLDAQVRFLRNRPDCCGVGVPYATSAQPAQCVFDIGALVDAEGIVSRPIRRLAEKQAILMTCSVLMFPREKAQGIRFGTERGAIEDVQFQIQLLARGPFGIAGAAERQILAVYRVHAENTSGWATYYYRGLKLLRQMEKQGAFDGVPPEQRSDVSAWLGFLGRAAAVTQLLLGRRLRGVETYLREFPHQLRERRFDFLAAYPVFAVAPLALVRSWSGKGRPDVKSDGP